MKEVYVKILIILSIIIDETMANRISINEPTTSLTTTTSSSLSVVNNYKDFVIVSVILGIYIKTKDHQIRPEERIAIKKSLIRLYNNDDSLLLNDHNNNDNNDSNDNNDNNDLRRIKELFLRGYTSLKRFFLRRYTYIILLSHLYSMLSFLIYSESYPLCCNKADALVTGTNNTSLVYNGTIVTILDMIYLIRGNDTSGAFHQFLNTLYEFNLLAILITQVYIFQTSSKNALGAIIFQSLLSIPFFIYSAYNKSGEFHQLYIMSYSFIYKREFQNEERKVCNIILLGLMGFVCLCQLPISFANIVYAIIGLSRLNGNHLTLTYNAYGTSTYDLDSWIINNDDAVCLYSFTGESSAFDGGTISSYCGGTCCIWSVY